MKFAGILGCIAVFGVVGLAQKYPCLPLDIKEDSIVGTIIGHLPGGEMGIRTISVRQTLKILKARCYRGKLIDGKRKSIKFYTLQGCWGNPPADYMEILARQAKELAELKKRFTVVEISCHTGTMPPQSISLSVSPVGVENI